MGGLDYREAGVDIEGGRRREASDQAHRGVHLHSRCAGWVRRLRWNVSDAVGRSNPVLVSSADGVGTKIKVAIEADRHDTIGHDLVNHCVNDILVQGATPLFFLDYVAFGTLVPTVVEAIVAGAGGGVPGKWVFAAGRETAEMRECTPPDYDLAGFIVGYVDESSVLGAHRVVERGRADCAGEQRPAHERVFIGATDRDRSDAPRR